MLKPKLLFAAYLTATDEQIGQASGTTFAVNSVGHAVCVEFRIGAGIVSFVPIPHDVPGDRMAAALVKVATAHFNKATDIEMPGWAQGITIPGAELHDARNCRAFGRARKTFDGNLQIADNEV